MKSEDLVVSSRRWMQRGLEAFGGDGADIDFAVHHVGVGMEHLLKAYLSAQHPALIVDAGSFESLLHAVGLSAHAKLPLSRVKTISAMEAFARSRILLRSKLIADDKQMQLVAASRNGVAHLGMHERTEAEEVLAACFRIADVLLSEIGEDAPSFWGDFQGTHDQMIKAEADRVRARYEAKLATAKRYFAARFGQMDRPAWNAVKEAIEAVELYPQHDTERGVCPACGEQGWLAGVKDLEVDHEINRDGGDDGELYVVMVGDTFGCAFCKLELDKAELALTEIDFVFGTDDDVNEFLEGYEPDEDLWRGR